MGKMIVLLPALQKQKQTMKYQGSLHSLIRNKELVAG